MLYYSVTLKELISRMGSVWKDLKAGSMENSGRTFDEMGSPYRLGDSVSRSAGDLHTPTIPKDKDTECL